MENLKMTKEEVLKKFKASRNRKKEYLVEMEQRMRKAYKERTGVEAGNFKAL
jgi:hypothetical protein